MVFPADPLQLVRHPSQLYEMFFEGLVTGLIIWNVAKMPKRPRGLMIGLFTVLYGVARFFIEYYREPDAQLGLLLGGSLSMGQILCLAMVLIGLGLIAYVYSRGVSADTPTPVPVSGPSEATAAVETVAPGDAPPVAAEVVFPEPAAHPPENPPVDPSQPAHGT